MAVTYANLEEFTLALGVLVPDMKAAYVEEDFIAQAVARLSEDFPAWATADLGDGSTTEWQLGEVGGDLEAFVVGFSDTWPFTCEELNAEDEPFAEPVRYPITPRIDVRTVAGVPTSFLVFSSAPSTNAKCRVRFRVEWEIEESSTTVPAKFHVAVVKLAAALKCAALATFYKASIDPAGGSDIFDARQYAEAYGADAERWRAEYRDAVGGSGGLRVGFATTKARTSVPQVFRPWGS